jgi:RHS repeat-associated protein
MRSREAKYCAGAYKYKYNGKEYQDELGLNLYDYGARNYDPALGRWMNVDPLAEQTPNWSPYAFCNNNPLFFTDPTGMSASPIYDNDGNFMGTDDQGLQGKAIVMNKENFKQGMSHEDALKKNEGVNGLSSEKAKSNLVSNYDSLPSRPDYDGQLTLDEANEHFRNGNGSALFVDMAKIDISGISTEDFNGKIGSKEAFNLFTGNSNSSDDIRVYGNITLRLYPENRVKAFQDTYNFEMHNVYNPLNWPRNLLTVIGREYAGPGTPFPINITGSKWIKPVQMVTK